MAWLEPQPNGIFHIAFRYKGEKFKKSLRTRCEHAASTRLTRVEENMRLVESGRLEVSPDVDIAAFLLSDGKINSRDTCSKKSELRSLRQYTAAFLASIPHGALEGNTIQTTKTHINHLHRVFGVAFRVVSLELEDLQKYVDFRSREKGIRGRNVSPTTIKKEVATFRAIWNWGVDAGHHSRSMPLKGLRYPKGNDKPPFQTSDQIERKIASQNLSVDEQKELWASLFLTADEIADLLDHVKQNSNHDFIYPMFVFAAHTGARRSEMIRSELDDIDFVAGQVTIREKKRVRGRHTTRSVPLSPFLESVLREWIANHPGGQPTFCIANSLPRSGKLRSGMTQLTNDEAHDHFKRSVARSKWSEARGWHVFRHSFCSNCAAAGIDQRLINGWVGHQTEEMVKRYRHLIPSQQRRAIADVFSKVSD
ncbi:MAG: site-specific integrase [Planctomycetales bacterium]|nr:site-specific integrase [Planctomycetales bacterium]